MLHFALFQGKALPLSASSWRQKHHTWRYPLLLFLSVYSSRSAFVSDRFCVQVVLPPAQGEYCA